MDFLLCNIFYPQKTPPNQKPQQLAHTLPHPYRDIFFSVIFPAKMFQENYGFLSYNKEKSLWQRILHYFLNFIFWLMVCFDLCLDRDFGLTAYQKNQCPSLSLIDLPIQVHKYRIVQSGNAGPLSGSILKEVCGSTHFMSLILTWSLQTRKAWILQVILHVGIFYTGNHGFFWASEISERTTKIVRSVKTSGTKTKGNYFILSIWETFVTDPSILFSSESHTALEKLL